MNWTIQPLPTRGPLFEGAIGVYADAFAEPPYSDPDRGREIHQRMQDTHGSRDGFHAYAAVLHGKVIGMIYGYRGANGQWWHDTVVRQLPPNLASRWMGDSYELVELAVQPESQGQGVGSSLITQLLDGRREATCVLSTRSDSLAHKLYQRHGFEIITEMTFATRGARFYIMGKSLNPD
jgi:ribosomal protein S18 acetylase RimI-like enzyme